MAIKISKRWLGSIYFSILFSLILGIVLSIMVIPQPIISEITISGVLLDMSQADSIIEELKVAQNDRHVKGVVLNIDSSGGAVNVIQAIYLEVLELTQYKPVVATINNIAASGGYYISVATNFIYAQPNATVGSVGVIGFIPEPEELDEITVTTGPFKLSGQSRSRATSEIATIQQQFVEAVRIQRGERLKMSNDVLSQASIYSGTEGLRYGLIDGIGTKTLAIQKVAELARIRNYEARKSLVQQTKQVDLEGLKSLVDNVPLYFYLYFEWE